MMRPILLIFLFLFSSSVLALDIGRVEVKCFSKERCTEMKRAFSSLRRSYIDIPHFYQILKLFIANEGLRQFSFQLFTQGEKARLAIDLDLKKQITSVEGPTFEGKGAVDFPSILPLKEGDYLDNSKIENTRKLLQDISRDKGYAKPNVRVEVKDSKEGAKVKIKVKLGKPVVVDEIKINSKSPFVKRLLSEKISYHKGTPFDSQTIKNEIEDIRKLLLQYGYYIIDFNLKNRLNSSGSVSLFVDVLNSETFSFHFLNTVFYGEDSLKEYLSGQMITLKRRMPKDTIIQLVREKYFQEGFRDLKVDIREEKSTNIYGDNNNHFLISLKSLERTFFERISFKGNNFFKSSELKDSFYEFATESIRVGAVDSKYLEEFRELLRSRYIENGFVSVFVDAPEIQKVFGQDKVVVNYRIREGIQTKVEKFKIEGLPVSLEGDILALLNNKLKEPFNPIGFKADLKAIEDYLKGQGYYYSEITNLNSKDLVQYKEDNSRVHLNVQVKLGAQIYVDNILVIGNRTTRRRLIEREISIRKGSLLTKQIVENSQTNLLSLGLFSSVQIRPIGVKSGSSDIIIFLREKDFGLIEIAPGIRTDVGLKLSGMVNYNNIDGMNKKISFKGSVNQRFDLTTLDEERRKNSNSLIEYDATINYSENHIFFSDYDFGLVLNKSRRRFFSFDADIQRISYSVSRNFTRWFSATIRQQLETISQFEATQERDDGFFQIGSFTPSVALDFRDRPVNPTKGAHFDLSVEFANPFFLSQQNDDLTIDYYKLTSRNRFYVPMSQNFVLAISTSFGIQENLATAKNSAGEKEGFIPGIKVFRLIGADIIRGFDDDEMNRLANGNDISAVAVDKRAYMFNLKFEPRYFLSDSTVLGMFYDAGRVFVDEFEMDDLRSAAGISFKYLTPVGTLDFNYGIKLLRKRDADGTLENPGRLNVSIGFF